jgi:quinohemoprotein ethanol dehydrogenase
MYAKQIPAPLPPAYAKYGEGWPAPQYEVLKAWDPVQRKEVWRAPYPGTQNGGILSTDGNLVFQGSSTGHLLVFNATTGKLLKDIFVGTGIQAAPISYEVDGEQYVAVMAGYGGAVLFFPGEQDAVAKYRNTGRILAFKILGDKVPLPALQTRTDTVPAPPDMVLNKQMMAAGQELYSSLCSACHSSFGKNHLSELPDLSAMSVTTHEWFKDILLKGKLSYYGMANFSDILTEKEVDALHQFLVSIQQERYNAQRSKKADQ